MSKCGRIRGSEVDGGIAMPSFGPGKVVRKAGSLLA